MHHPALVFRNLNRNLITQPCLYKPLLKVMSRASIHVPFSAILDHASPSKINILFLASCRPPSPEASPRDCTFHPRLVRLETAVGSVVDPLIYDDRINQSAPEKPGDDSCSIPGKPFRWECYPHVKKRGTGHIWIILAVPHICWHYCS